MPSRSQSRAGQHEPAMCPQPRQLQGTIKLQGNLPASVRAWRLAAGGGAAAPPPDFCGSPQARCLAEPAMACLQAGAICLLQSTAPPFAWPACRFGTPSCTPPSGTAASLPCYFICSAACWGSSLFPIALAAPIIPIPRPPTTTDFWQPPLLTLQPQQHLQPLAGALGG